MIYDGMSVIERYRGLYRGLDVLIGWLNEHDYNALETGRHEILGNKVFALVQDAKTRTYGNARYEVHRRYMDVQVDIEGNERFFVTPGPTEPLEDYDEASDKQYVKAAPDNGDEIEGTLEKDHFAIFVANEPHMPNVVCATTEPVAIRKICFKILADKCWDEG